LGEKTIIEFFNLGWLESPADIFRLHRRRADIVGREGWQDKSVDNLLNAIEAKRQPDAARLLFGLGIRHVGAVTARDLCKRFVTCRSCARWRKGQPVAHRRQRRGERFARSGRCAGRVVGIDGIGPAVVEALGDFFHEPHNVACGRIC
jgi:DNA ligase (NAD+)